MHNLPAPAEIVVRALLASAIRHLLVALGTWLISHRADQKVVDNAHRPDRGHAGHRRCHWLGQARA